MRASLCASHVFFLAFIYFGHTIRLARISVPHPETVPGPQKWEARILTTSHQRTPTSFYSFVDRHSGCFRIFSVVNKAAMNTGVPVSFWISVSFFQIYTQAWIYMLGCKVVLFLVFEEPPYCFPQWLHQFTFPPTVYGGYLFSTSLITFAFCGFFFHI